MFVLVQSDMKPTLTTRKKIQIPGSLVVRIQFETQSVPEYFRVYLNAVSDSKFKEPWLTTLVAPKGLLKQDLPPKLRTGKRFQISRCQHQ